MRPESARNEGITGPKRLHDRRCITYTSHEILEPDSRSNEIRALGFQCSRAGQVGAEQVSGWPRAVGVGIRQVMNPGAVGWLTLRPGEVGPINFRGFGFRIPNFRFWVLGFGFRVSNVGLRVSRRDLFRVQFPGFRLNRNRMAKREL